MLQNELEGLLVISLEQAVAAPYCGLLLADAGARVIKVERPEGDFARQYDDGVNGESAIFAWLNRGKESITLNLKNAEDLSVMKAMLRKADVFLSNLAPGRVAEMGLSGQRLRIENPKLITCTISGYGETGAGAQKKAYDFLVQGEVGLCSVTGSRDTPARVGISVTDLSTGLTAFSGILRALIQQGKSGIGSDVTVSMFDVMADWMNMPLMAHRYMGGAPARSGLQHSFIAPYGAFECKEGKQILLSVQNNREWVSFCDHVLEKPSLASDPRFENNPNRFENRDILDQIVSHCFATLEIDVISSRLDRAGIANGALNTVADLSEHICLKNARASIGAAEVTMAALPLSLNNETGIVPALGQHSVHLRKEFAL